MVFMETDVTFSSIPGIQWRMLDFHRGCQTSEREVPGLNFIICYQELHEIEKNLVAGGGVEGAP